MYKKYLNVNVHVFLQLRRSVVASGLNQATAEYRISKRYKSFFVYRPNEIQVISSLY